MMNLALMRTATGKEDPVTSVAEDKFIRVNYSSDATQINHRVQVTDTSQHQLFRGDCVNQALMVKLLQRNH
jgi:hypothetical protein